MDKYDSNGDYSYPENFKRKEMSDKVEENDGENEENQASTKTGEYVRELMAEKISIDQKKLPNAVRLLDQGKI
ncbi:hypothetical protein NQ318_013948 [Aromia moschata]|uniref:Uncharacterized protein n=1 Tax=Aromia moschata TaxID=1265417 RepID=A0AAV8XH97_9CUCU|nr:hypothetical protein NQ318_013948 [Aromia moschata]